MRKYILYLSSLILSVSIKTQICETYKTEIEIIKIVRNKVLNEINMANNGNKDCRQMGKWRYERLPCVPDIKKKGC